MRAAAAALAPPDIPRRALAACGLLALLLVAVVALDLRPAWVLVALTAVAAAVASYRYFVQWHVLAGSIVLCILVVPIARYGLPITLPFQLEPYRFLVLIVAILWLASLLAESKTLRFQRTGLGGPLVVLTAVLVISVAANLGTIHARGVTMDVVFKFSFFASFLLVTLILGTVLRTREDIDRVVKVMVGGGALVAFSTLIENKTGFNAFDHLHQVFPVLVFDPSGAPNSLEVRGSGFRVYGSAQHPLALGAALVLLIPPATYLCRRTKSRVWYGALALIAIAALATVARTAVMMLLVEAILLACLKPRAVKRIWWMIPPFLVVVNIAVPATLGTLKASFFPEGGLIAQQNTNAGGDASNRISDLGPGLQEAKQTFFFGQGWGTRVPANLDPAKTRRILDNQWLGVLLEAGWVGVLAWGWFFVRNVRLLSRAALRDPTDLSWLSAGLAASILGFAVGMFTYDAFGFPQATLLMFIMVGLGIATRRVSYQAPRADDDPRRLAAVS
jgi:polysaccharide biosynthesis protein PslJ